MIDTQEYPLTLEHIRQFLATKEERDPIGIQFNSLYCLLSETLNWLYPLQCPWRVDIGTYSAGLYVRILPGTLERLRVAFDYGWTCGSPAIWPSRTKAELRALLLEQEEGLPFGVAALFSSPSRPTLHPAIIAGYLAVLAKPGAVHQSGR